MLWIIIAIIISYLVGSIPTAYIFGRCLKGIDIRKHGSGNVGATNALRVLGKGAGITVLVIDILKGFIPVVFVANIFAFRQSLISVELLRIVLGIVCVCGHNWTVFLEFKGGKGIASTFGMLIGLATMIAPLRIVLLATILTWFICFFISKIVSLSSIVASIFLPVFMIFFPVSKTLFISGIILSIFVLIRHKSNIVRLLKKSEPQLSFRKKTS